MPDRAALAHPEVIGAHATALWETLHMTSLRLILHAPEDLVAERPSTTGSWTARSATRRCAAPR